MHRRIQQTRQLYRSSIRKQQVNRQRANIRNLMLAMQNAQEQKCTICEHQWIVLEPIEKITTLMVQTFNRKHICMSHIELLFSKTLQTILSSPETYLQILCKCSNLTFYSRKLILLFEIFNNQLLMSNQRVQECIFESFQEQQGFVVQLMDSAYGLNDGLVRQEQRLFGIGNIKTMALGTVVYVFEKYPLLFEDLLQEYPLSDILRWVSQEKQQSLYQLLSHLFSQSQNSPELYSKIIPRLEFSLCSHLDSIRSTHLPLQLELQLLLLLETVLKTKSVYHPETVKEILEFCGQKMNNFQIHVIKIVENVVQVYERAYQEQQKEVVGESLWRLVQSLTAVKEKRDHAMNQQIL